MLKTNRGGNRKTRKQLIQEHVRVPDLGYYTVITNTRETEKVYFEGLRDSLPEEFRRRLVIKVYSTKTSSMVDEGIKYLQYRPQYGNVWIVFDRDKEEQFDDIIEKATKNKLHVGWSNPCFEIWLWAYFGKMSSFHDSVSCVKAFENKFKEMTEQDYSKSDVDIYRKMCSAGNEENAIQIARRKYNEALRNCEDEFIKPSQMLSVTTLYKLVEEIRSKTANC